MTHKFKSSTSVTAPRITVSLLTWSLLAALFATCSITGHAQTASTYVPLVVVSSVAPVSIPTPPLPQGSSAYGTGQGALTPVYSPTSLALDACGNLYTLDKGSDNNLIANSPGDLVTEIPANGGYASIVENVGGYENVPLGQDPTYKNLLVGHQYSGNSSLGLIPLTNCVPNATNEVKTGESPICYYNIIGDTADFIGNYYISSNQTACVNNQYYLFQDSGGNGSTLLTNTDLPAFKDQYAYTSPVADLNQNVYFLQASAGPYVSELPYSGGSGGTYATAPVQFGGTFSNPVGLSVDAKSNLYIVDAGNGSIFEIPYESTPATSGLNPADQFTIVSGLSPAAVVSVAVQASGDLYYTGYPQYGNATPVYKLSRSSTNFGTVVVGQTATRSLNFQFNASATLSQIEAPGGAFAIQPGGNGSCTVGVAYAPNGSYNQCTIVVTFTPGTVESQTSAVVLKIQTAQGQSSVTAILQGIAQAAPVTATATTLTANPSSNLMAGEPITLTATVAPLSGSAIPTGTVTFADPAGGSVNVPLAGGKAVYSGTVPPVGTYSVYAKYSGASGFTASQSATITSTVTAAVPYLIPNGTYIIVSENSGLDVEVPGSSTVSGATLDQAATTGGANQIWQVINLGNNYIELLNENSNMALEVPGYSLVHGLFVDQAPYTAGTNQIWQVVASGSYVILLNENSGLALDVYGDSTSPGAPIDQYPGQGSANQAWTFTHAAYKPPVISSVSITPGSSKVLIGQQQQFTAKVKGTGSITNTVTWSLTASASSNLSLGTISTSGLYITPYPAPASVTLTATSTQDATKSASVTITLASPAASTGPALSVDAGNQTHAISPDIYGINGNNNGAMPKLAQTAGTTVDRWGGDGATRYNYKNDQYNSASDYWFQNEGVGTEDNSQFNQQVVVDAANRMKTLGTVPLIGYTANGTGACSYSIAKYGAQEPSNGLAAEPYKPDCGFGVSVATGQNVVNDPTDTSIAIDDTWTTGWVQYLTNKFGTAANGGVAIYDLDNEPSDWSGVHKDVHPLPFTYDELSNKGLAYSAAIKAVDPTAEVSGPIIDGWYDYFYSAKDVNAGYGQGPCYAPWANPIDRTAHGGTSFLAYYLQQFAAYAAGHAGARLLDYLDIHGYYAAHPNGVSVAFAPAGDTSVQAARVNSTRAYWDSTYTDSYYTIPNYPTDPNYVPQSGNTCNPPPLQPLQLIPFLQQLAASNYPGTKAAIDEYNFGAQESVNGAVTQADVLGIFGAHGLDLGAYWPGTNDPTQEGPILQAFAIYRNYDGNDSTFGNKALASTSTNQNALSVYGALRTADNSVTVVVINKSYGDLTTTLSLANMGANGQAQVYLYSNANLASIQQKASITVTPPAKGSSTSSISTTFPAQSITLLVIPKS